MADTDVYTKQQTLAPQIPPNPNKFYNHFLYKAIIVSIFLVVVPLFPSQAPDFVSQTLHTGSWELLQLLFVGIAVSYGLFSKRSNETEKEYVSKFDNAQLYVSRLLQVSPVFDDETESPPEPDEGKVQTWNSQYYRGEPMVVVAQESSVLEEQSGHNPQLVGKPLLLPVRSLKTPSAVEPTNESNVNTNWLSRSNSKLGSRRSFGNSSKSHNGEFLGVSPEDLEKKVTETVVLRSPIPWRSRSGRMEVKKDDLYGPALYSPAPSMEDSELNRVESRSFRSQSFNSSKTSSTSPSPNKFSPSPSLSSEMQAKNVEDFVRKKISHKSSIPPPPPPPPPPPFLHKSPLSKSNYRVGNDEVLSEKEMRRIVRNATNGLNGNEGEEFLSWGNSLMGKSVRTTKGRDFNEGLTNSSDEKWSNVNVAAFIGKRGQSDKFVHEASPAMSKQNFYKHPKEEEQFVEKVVMETDNDSESEYDEDDEFEELPNHEETTLKNVNDMGPDVDKKADEFIAKFREQIRLQRLASIRRPAGQTPKTSVR